MECSDSKLGCGFRIGKSGGKSASGKSALVNSVSGFSFTLIAASVVLGSGQVNAAEVTGNTGVSGDDKYCFYNAPSQSVICGDATTKTTDKTDNKPAKSVVIGFGATNDGETNVAIGAKSQSSKAASIAIGIFQLGVRLDLIKLRYQVKEEILRSVMEH